MTYMFMKTIEATSARIAQTGVIDALVAALSARNYADSTQRSKQIRDLIEPIRYHKGR